MNDTVLSDARDRATYLMKSAAPEGLADALVQAMDVIHEALIVHYAAKIPHIFALPLPDQAA